MMRHEAGPPVNQTATTYRANPRRVSVIGFVLCAVLAFLFWDVGQLRWSTWIARTISVVCGLVALMLVFYKEVSIDPAAGVVTETTLLFGLLRVRRRDRRFSEFRAVRCYVSSESDGGTKTWAVALVPEAGYPIDLRYFSDPTAGDEADEFARELGDTTGLEVRSERA
jgi:hypothetical protein